MILGLVAMIGRASAEQNDNKVVWRRIVGIAAPGSLVGRPGGGAECEIGVECVEGTPAAWTATDGRAELDLVHGRIEFTVRGLVLAADPAFENMGTTGPVSMVKGTLVCNDTEPGVPDLVDTDAVALSDAGNAKFKGHVALPGSCLAEPDDIVFLIRIADVELPQAEFLIDLWNAFGAIRTNTDED
jgi:hypothetical protein